jgi:predicted RNA-binding protein
MKQGDYVIFYSGKEFFESSEKCQKFTAIGKVKDDEVYQFQMTPDFSPHRRKIDFLATTETSILPLITDLEFIQNKKSWGYPFRWGFFEIKENDFKLIEEKMCFSKSNFIDLVTSFVNSDILTIIFLALSF